MDQVEIVHLLESADALGAKVTEALEVLAQHAVVEASATPSVTPNVAPEAEVKS